MTEVAHTPGPWEWREDSDSIRTMRTLSPGILVLDNDPGCGGPWGDWLDRANARLIAAAPDQHDAAVALDGLSLVILSAVNFADKAMVERVAEALRVNRAAISKALGEA